MSFIKRLGNLAKGTIAAAGSDESDLERRAREQALKEELARLTPSPEAHAELKRRKSGGGGASSSPSRAAAGSAAPTGLDAELARLDAAFADGVLTQAEYDRKRAEAVARSQDEAGEDGDAPPEIKRTL